MKFTVSDFVTKTELNDFKVYSINLDIKKSEFKVFLEGAYWFKENTSQPIAMEDGGYVSVSAYSAFEARYFLPQDKLWYTLDYNDLEIIDEVNEKSYEGGILRLAGIGKKSGYWIEYLIGGGEIEIYFKE